MIEQPRGGDFEPPLPPFLGEPVGHFIQGGTAEVANTSTCASSAVRNIPPPSAKTKTPICEQIPLSPEHQFQLSLRGNSLVTPVRVDRFEQLLAGYDRTLKPYLINGFRFGFRINFTGEITSFEAPNLKSALQNLDILFSKLSKELDAGRIAGPFDTAPFPVFRTSPVGIIPKKVPNEFRLIHHMSYPKADLLTIAFRMTALPYNMPRLMTPLKSSTAGAGFLLNKNRY